MSQEFEKSDEQLEQLIGKQLKAHRLQRNFNQTELAEKAGVARRTITSIENGKGHHTKHLDPPSPRPQS